MVEKSDEFDEWILNRQSFPHQNFALGKFQYCILREAIAIGLYNLLTLSLSGHVGTWNFTVLLV